MSDVEKTEFELPPELARKVNSPIDANEQTEDCLLYTSDAADE